ncbi:GGDEF domain-containing protein [Rhodococcus aerolatus]
MARAWLLGVEALAAVGLALALLTTHVGGADVARVALLAVLSVVYREATSRVERLKRYLGSDTVFSEQVSVWAFAATLLAPAGWAALLVVLCYAHILVQRHRDGSGHPHRAVYTGATLVLATLAAGGVLHLSGGADALDGGVAGALAVVGSLVVFTTVNFALVLVGAWLATRPPSVRVLLPDADGVGYELATLVLGVVTAVVLDQVPELTPLVLLLVTYLHRSSLVNALHHTSRTDAKTGLLTLAAWQPHAREVLVRASRAGVPVSVLFCDLDHFKRVNDTCGHLVGDELLVAVADCLRRELRGPDALARFGGEEFVAVLEGLDESAAESVAERLRAAVARIDLPGAGPVTISIGLAHHAASERAATTALEDLVARADGALRQAKEAGRNRVHVA